MKLNLEAHQTLSLLHSRYGVLNIMVIDNAQEQVKGDFGKKNRDVITHVKQTEPHSKWMNAAEGAIHELKKVHERDMVQQQLLKVLWDHCLERQAHIRSLTAHAIFGLSGQVPNIMVSGETTDISPYT